MDRDRAVAATFVPAPTTFTLTVAGGASGSGTVYSTPAGISCTIADGEAVSGNCSAGFPRGTIGQAHGDRLGRAGDQGVGRRPVREVGRGRLEEPRVVRHDDVEERERRDQLRSARGGDRCRHDGAVVRAVRLARGGDPCRPAAEPSGRHLRQAPPSAGALEPGQPGHLHQPPPPGGLLLQRSDAAEKRQALPCWRACRRGQLRHQVGVSVRSGDQSVASVGEHAERALVPDAHDLAQRSNPRHFGRRHGRRAQPDPGVVPPGTEPVEGTDRGRPGACPTTR